MPWVGLQCVIVVFSGHTHLLFNIFYHMTSRSGSELTLLLYDLIQKIQLVLILILVLRICCDWRLKSKHAKSTFADENYRSMPNT